MTPPGFSRLFLRSARPLAAAVLTTSSSSISPQLRHRTTTTVPKEEPQELQEGTTKPAKMGRKFFVGGNWKMNGNKESIDKIVGFLKEGPLDPNTGEAIMARFILWKRGNMT